MEIIEEGSVNRVDTIISDGRITRQKFDGIEGSEYCFVAGKFCFSKPDKPQTISIEGKFEGDYNIVFTNSNDHSLFNKEFVEASRRTYSQDIKVLDYTGDVIGRYPKGRTNNFAGNVTFNKPIIFSLDKIDFDKVTDSDRTTVIFIRDIGIYKKFKVQQNLIDYLKGWIVATEQEIKDRGLEDKIKFVVNNSFVKKACEEVAGDFLNYLFHFISSIEINSNDISYLIEYCFGCDITEEKSLLNTFLKYDCNNFEYLFSHSNCESIDDSSFDHLMLDQRGKVRSENSCIASCVTGRRNGRIEFKCADGETYDIVMVFSIKDVCPVDYKFNFSVENNSNIFKIDGNESDIFVPEQWIWSDIMEKTTEITLNYYKIWNLFANAAYINTTFGNGKSSLGELMNNTSDIEDEKKSFIEDTLIKYPSEFMTILISKDLRKIINDPHGLDPTTSLFLDLMTDMCLIMRINTLRRLQHNIDDMFRFKLKKNQINKKKRVRNGLPSVHFYDDNSSTNLMGRACSSYVGNATSLGCT